MDELQACELKFPVWRPEIVAAARRHLRERTAVELSRTLPPPVVEYIMELRASVELWRRMYNDKGSSAGGG